LTDRKNNISFGDTPIVMPALLCELKDCMPDMNYRYVVLSNEISRIISRRHTSTPGWHRLMRDVFVKDHMRPLTYSDDVIEAMIDAMCGEKLSEYDKDVYREALRGLVRLGQAEQMLSMQLDFNTLTTGPELRHDRH
jgi:hypothetical protein